MHALSDVHETNARAIYLVVHQRDESCLKTFQLDLFV